jgi:hypothetical protein
MNGRLDRISPAHLQRSLSVLLVVFTPGPFCALRHCSH